MRVIYEAVRGDERIRGGIDEIAAAVGQCPKYVYKMIAGIRGARNEWKVRRLCRQEWEYIAVNPKDDPIIGTLEEVATILCYSQRYVRLLAETGRTTSDGWSVERRVTYRKV